MKHILILVAVLVLQAHAARITAEEDQKLTNWDSSATECRTETGVDKELTAKFRLADDDQVKDKLLAENDKLKLYIVCLCTKMELINADGLIQKDALKKDVSRDITDAAIVDKIVDKCAVQKDSAAETVNEMMKCASHEMKVNMV